MRRCSPNVHCVSEASETACGLVDLGSLGVDAPEEDTLVVCERVHRRQRDVESRGGVVDGEHVNRRPVERELPAGAAFGRAKARDGCSTSNELGRQRADGRELCREGKE